MVGRNLVVRLRQDQALDVCPSSNELNLLDQQAVYAICCTITDIFFEQRLQRTF